MASIDELWLVDFGEPFPGEPAFQRPALVLGPPDTFGQDMPFIFVCPLTTKYRGLSLHIEVEGDDTSGLSNLSYIQCELLRSVSRRRLVHQIGAVDPSTSRRVTEVVKVLLNH